jgi:hypothetical protein
MTKRLHEREVPCFVTLIFEVSEALLDALTDDLSLYCTLPSLACVNRALGQFIVSPWRRVFERLIARYMPRVFAHYGFFGAQAEQHRAWVRTLLATQGPIGPVENDVMKRGNELGSLCDYAFDACGEMRVMRWDPLIPLFLEVWRRFEVLRYARLFLIRAARPSVICCFTVLQEFEFSIPRTTIGLSDCFLVTVDSVATEPFYTELGKYVSLWRYHVNETILRASAQPLCAEAILAIDAPLCLLEEAYRNAKLTDIVIAPITPLEQDCRARFWSGPQRLLVEREVRQILACDDWIGYLKCQACGDLLSHIYTDGERPVCLKK